MASYISLRGSIADNERNCVKYGFFPRCMSHCEIRRKLGLPPSSSIATMSSEVSFSRGFIARDCPIKGRWRLKVDKS